MQSLGGQHGGSHGVGLAHVEGHLFVVEGQRRGQRTLHGHLARGGEVAAVGGGGLVGDGAGRRRADGGVLLELLEAVERALLGVDVRLGGAAGGVGGGTLQGTVGLIELDLRQLDLKVDVVDVVGKELLVLGHVRAQADLALAQLALGVELDDVVLAGLGHGAIAVGKVRRTAAQADLVDLLHVHRVATRAREDDSNDDGSDECYDYGYDYGNLRTREL